MRWHILAAALIALAALLATGSSASADTTIVVQHGDNLASIAQRNGSSVSALVRANGLASADRIYAGQRLTIPTSRSVFKLPSASGGSTHVVRPGETLYRVALNYGTTVSALVASNGLSSADRIYAGQRLTIPGGGGFGGPALNPPAPKPVANTPGRGIVIDLSSQTLTAMEGGRAVQTFVVSTGKASTPTPVGNFSIYSRYATQHMVGPGYSLPGVPYVQYFTGAYAIHGSYWHNSFGVPVSHGCINMRPADAGWLWSWSGHGTPVTVRY